MTILQRSFASPDDWNKMSSLSRSSRQENLHVTDLPFRFTSGAYDVPTNSNLWFDASGELVAWATLQSPFGEIDYALRPDAPPLLHRDILCWADARANIIRGTPVARPIWFVNVFADQEQRCQDLEDAGFAPQFEVGEDSWRKVWLKASLPVAFPRLPEGFVLDSFAKGDVDAYVALHRGTFGSENMTTAWRHRVLQQPDYRADLDLLIKDSDGNLVGFCVCWFDEAAQCGQIKPLGVAVPHRRRGVAQALVSEGMRRLKRRGAKMIFVEADDVPGDAALSFYKAAGFRRERDVLVYRKDYPAKDG